MGHPAFVYWGDWGERTWPMLMTRWCLVCSPVSMDIGDMDPNCSIRFSLAIKMGWKFGHVVLGVRNNLSKFCILGTYLDTIQTSLMSTNIFRSKLILGFLSSLTSCFLLYWINRQVITGLLQVITAFLIRDTCLYYRAPS